MKLSLDVIMQTHSSHKKIVASLKHMLLAIKEYYFK